MTRFALPVVLLALGWSAAPAAAIPAASPFPRAESPLTRVASGCRPGYTRDAMGRCHHAFNRFRHHDRFRAYTREHCTKVSTPNGAVKRCRI